MPVHPTNLGQVWDLPFVISLVLPKLIKRNLLNPAEPAVRIGQLKESGASVTPNEGLVDGPFRFGRSQ
jgi:hypothetical protein